MRKPNKILDHKDTATGREFRCFWHDPGYADQDEEKWLKEADVMAFPDLLADYNAVPKLTTTTCIVRVC